VAYQLETSRLDDFLGAVSVGRTVFALGPENEHIHLVRSETWQPGKHVLGAYRPIEPLKSLVFQPRELLGTLMKEGPAVDLPEQIVIGVKNCDLSALKIHDYVFLNSEPPDPVYKEAREKTLLIGCDCTDCRETCFCPVVNEQPFAREGFDVNLSPTPDGIVVESGSDKGQTLLGEVQNLLKPADEKILAAREQAREAMTQKVANAAGQKGLRPGQDLQKAIAGTAEADLWEEFAANCVECGACNFICCTCHCFLLADGRSKAGLPSRLLQWDSCLFKTFAQVAGGGNPRKHRAERLYNRFDKKFNFFPQVLNMYACDGCGRCIEACTGNIDIREVLNKAITQTGG